MSIELIDWNIKDDFHQMSPVFDYFIHIYVIVINVLALGEEADFGALNCQHSTKVDARQNVQLTTEPAFLPNACYRLVLYIFDPISRFSSL